MTRPKKMPLAEISSILRKSEEWYFNGIPDDEVQACYLYEFARELIRENEKVRALYERLESVHQKKAIKALTLVFGAPYQIPLIRKDMLKKPWQDLPQRDRKHAVIAAKGHEAIVEVMRTQGGIELPNKEPSPMRCSLLALDESEFLTMKIPSHSPIQEDEKIERHSELLDGFVGWLPPVKNCTERGLDFMFNTLYPMSERGEDFSNVRFGIFAIDFDETVEAITNRFKEWLISQKRVGDHEKKDESGWDNTVASYRRKLKCLGVKRLSLTQLSDQDLISKLEKSGKLPYKNKPEWSNARKSFAENLQQFKNLCRFYWEK